MNLFVDLARGRGAALSVLRLWLVFLGCAAAAAVLIAALQRVDTAFSRSQAPAAAGGERVPVAFAPTFAEAAGSLRAGRFADAYGRFVALADEGDVDAARIALVMHRFGPEVFGSQWDASGEQLEAWTQWSETAARRELVQRSAPGRRSLP